MERFHLIYQETKITINYLEHNSTRTDKVKYLTYRELAQVDKTSR